MHVTVGTIRPQNAIRKKTEALNYLRLGSRLDAVVSRLDTQVCCAEYYSKASSSAKRSCERKFLWHHLAQVCRRFAGPLHQLAAPDPSANLWHLRRCHCLSGAMAAKL